MLVIFFLPKQLIDGYYVKIILQLLILCTTEHIGCANVVVLICCCQAEQFTQFHSHRHWVAESLNYA
jgi:hypothetical protein